MKRFLIYLLLFPAIATVSFYAVLYILTGAVVDSLSGPAFCYLMFIGPTLVVALVDWLAPERAFLSSLQPRFSPLWFQLSVRIGQAR